MAPELPSRRWDEHDGRGDSRRSPPINLNQSLVKEENPEDQRNGRSRHRERNEGINGDDAIMGEYEEPHRGRRARRNRGVEIGLDLNVGHPSPPQPSPAVKRSPRSKEFSLAVPSGGRRGRSPPRRRSVTPPLPSRGSRRSVTPPHAPSSDRKATAGFSRRRSSTPPLPPPPPPPSLTKRSGSPPASGSRRKRSVTPPHVVSTRRRSFTPPSGSGSRGRSISPSPAAIRRRSGTPPLPPPPQHSAQPRRTSPVELRRSDTPPDVHMRRRSVTPEPQQAATPSAQIADHQVGSPRERSFTPVRRRPNSPPNRGRSPVAARKRTVPAPERRRSLTPIRRRSSPVEAAPRKGDNRSSRSPLPRGPSPDVAARRKDHRASRSPDRLQRERSRTRTPPRRSRSPPRRSRSPPSRRRSPRRDRSPGARGYSPRRRSSPGRYRGSRRRSPGRRPWSPPQNRSNGVGKPGNNLFIAGFNFITTERDLEKKFSRYGRVMDVRIVRDKRSGESRGFGFLTLERDEDADAAIKSLDQTEWNGRIVLVEKAKTPTRF
ncbi:hypothetical protein R1sor_019563 [Riccia sorocarpa]|uniref:RRM domain-containing protein n=1 Tax=Riccia sorocarpa TaxID=122646 RepID=A0ABD3IDH4_9MARC